MHRRRFLATVGTGAATVAGGCLGIDAPGSDGHPLAGTTQTVLVEDNSDGPHDVAENARQALSYWEQHSEEYAGFGIDFELDDSGNADLVIAYGDDPRGCENVPEYSSRVLGCAPLLREGSRVPQPITARVVAATRPFGEVLTTTKHEIGHVLGLDHDAEPRHIMSNRPEDRIALYALRIELWETVLAAREGSTAAVGLLNYGIEAYERREYELAAGALEAVAADLAALRTSLDEAVASTAEFEGQEGMETVALDRLRDLLAQLRDRIDAARGIATALAASARAGVAGNATERDEELGAAVEQTERFNAVAPVELREVAFALGLVQGVEREEPVVELDGEPPSR
jgi:predicted Zn-dependent protease with MMP-like domain